MADHSKIEPPTDEEHPMPDDQDLGLLAIIWLAVLSIAGCAPDPAEQVRRELEYCKAWVAAMATPPKVNQPKAKNVFGHEIIESGPWTYYQIDEAVWNCMAVRKGVSR